MSKDAEAKAAKCQLPNVRQKQAELGHGSKMPVTHRMTKRG